MSSGTPVCTANQVRTFADGQEALACIKSDPDVSAVITATGLAMQMFGGIELSVNGQRVDPGATLAYKGVMLSGVPNLASVFGYINASWTLRADLVADFLTMARCALEFLV